MKPETRSPRFALLVATAVVAATALGVARSASAGGGPENLFLVVNQADDDSKQIANFYIRWRDIPPRNVFYVDWEGGKESCGVEKFRTELLLPALNAINQRGLALQIDYLVYSAGFPWRVVLKGDFPDKKFGREMKPTASLTGATYLWPYIAKKSPGILTPEVNWYAPQPEASNLLRCTALGAPPSRAFRGRYFWKKDRTRSKDLKESQRYLLSAMLGVTTGRGNTVEEVLAYLQSAVTADRSRPGGTFYFAQNNNVRSQTRHACFAAAAAALRKEGAQAKVVQGKAPDGARDVAGLTSGTAQIDIAEAGVRLLPGAICDNLTSYGGDLRQGVSQTPISHFLRNGAAGACGTVIEPLAIQAKFPLPSIHLHYRRGCSLAESLYQSVSGPYQLLVIGDPLCQPWAKPPKLQVDGFEPGQTVTQEAFFTPRINPGLLTPTRPCEVFIDGRLYAPAPTDKPFKLDVSRMPAGQHEIRFVAFTTDAVEAQSRVILPFDVETDPQQSLDLVASPFPRASHSGQIVLTATFNPPVTPAAEEPNGPPSREVIFRHNWRELGRVKLETAQEATTASLTIEASELGKGPVRLWAQVTGGGPLSEPLSVLVR